MAEPAKEKNLARTAGAVSFATLISRVLGLIREMVIAKYFDRFATDAFFAAYRIPNLLRDLFAEGALSSAFVPTFTEYRQNRGPHEAWRLANILLNVLTIVLSVVTLIILFGAKYLVYFLVSGFSTIPGKIELSVQLTQIMAPFLLCVALAAAVMGILNTFGKFFVPAVAPALYNLFCIVGGVVLSPLMPRLGLHPVTSIAIGSLFGGAAQLYFQLPSLYKCGFRYQAILSWHDPGLRKIMTLMVPAIFGLAATQINILIDNQLASYFGNGPVSWLNYAFRLMQLPIGLFGVAIATVNLATISKKIAANDLEGVKTNLAEAIKLAAFLNIPATVGLMVLRYPIIQAIYERGMFTSEHTRNTGDALLFYAIGLYAYTLVKIVTPAFYAMGDTRTPVKFAALVILFKVVFNLLLIRKLGFLGLALGTSIASLLNTAFLYGALRKRIGSFHGQHIGQTLLKITAASIFMGGAVHFVHILLTRNINTDNFGGQTIVLGFTIAVGLVVLMISSALLRIREAVALMQRLKRRW